MVFSKNNLISKKEKRNIITSLLNDLRGSLNLYRFRDHLDIYYRRVSPDHKIEKIGKNGNYIVPLKYRIDVPCRSDYGIQVAGGVGEKTHSLYQESFKYLFDKDYASLRDQDIDPVRIYEDIIKILIEKGIDPIIILTPYHPYIFQCSSPEMICRVLYPFESYIRKLADKENLVLIGSFDPRPFGIESSHFRDQSHLKPSGLARLNLLAENRPDYMKTCEAQSNAA